MYEKLLFERMNDKQKVPQRKNKSPASLLFFRLFLKKDNPNDAQ